MSSFYPQRYAVRGTVTPSSASLRGTLSTASPTQVAPVRHSQLLDRDAADQHSMSSITGLEQAMTDINDAIEDVKEDLDTAVGNKSFVSNVDIDEILNS